MRVRQSSEHPIPNRSCVRVGLGILRVSLFFHSLGTLYNRMALRSQGTAETEGEEGTMILD